MSPIVIVIPRIPIAPNKRTAFYIRFIIILLLVIVCLRFYKEGEDLNSGKESDIISVKDSIISDFEEENVILKVDSLTKFRKYIKDTPQSRLIEGMDLFSAEQVNFTLIEGDLLPLISKRVQEPENFGQDISRLKDLLLVNADSASSKDGKDFFRQTNDFTTITELVALNDWWETRISSSVTKSNDNSIGHASVSRLIPLVMHIPDVEKYMLIREKKALTGTDICKKYVDSCYAWKSPFQGEVHEICAKHIGPELTIEPINLSCLPLSAAVSNVFLAVFRNASISRAGHYEVRDSKMQKVFGFYPLTHCYADKREPEWHIFSSIKSDENQYDSVISISQYYGEEVFHFIVEALPRIAPFVDSLVTNPSFSKMKIHITENGLGNKYLKFLGIPEDRIVTGNVYAKHAYYPSSIVACGLSSIYNIRRLREIIHERILARTFNRTIKETSVLVIKRKGSRNVVNHDDLVAAIEESLLKTKSSQLRVTVFDYEQTQDIPSIMKLFYDAQIIVGPHGAGLSNMVASRKGTHVIEFLTKTTVFCYAYLADQLDINYVGFDGDPENHNDEAGININLRMFKSVFRQVLNKLRLG